MIPNLSAALVQGVLKNLNVKAQLPFDEIVVNGGDSANVESVLSGIGMTRMSIEQLGIHFTEHNAIPKGYGVFRSKGSVVGMVDLINKKIILQNSPDFAQVSNIIGNALL